MLRADQLDADGGEGEELKQQVHSKRDCCRCSLLNLIINSNDRDCECRLGKTLRDAVCSFSAAGTQGNTVSLHLASVTLWQDSRFVRMSCS
jgi:hypothetical protein